MSTEAIPAIKRKKEKVVSYLLKLFQVLGCKPTFALDFGWVNPELWAQVLSFMLMGVMLPGGNQSSIPCLVCTGENLFHEGILLHLIPSAQAVPRGCCQAGAAQADAALSTPCSKHSSGLPCKLPLP